MTNIVLFLFSVYVYFFVWSLIMAIKEGCNGRVARPSFKLCAKVIGVISLLCLPVNIAGNVFTIAGNAVAEKSVYSIFSAYQDASEIAFALVNVGYQKAGQAFNIFGLSYQAGGDVTNGVGLGVQRAGGDSIVILGFAPYQHAGRDAVVAFGLSGYQHAGKDAIVGIGLGGYQYAQRGSLAEIGLSLYQQGGRSAQTVIGLGLYQRVPGKDRAFGFWDRLRADKAE